MVGYSEERSSRDELLIPMSQTQNRTLRSTSNGSLAVPRSKTAIFDGSFSCTAPRMWNQLPEVAKRHLP